MATLVGPSSGISGRAELASPLSAVASKPAFLNTLLCGDEAGNLLVVDHRIGGSSATVLKIAVGSLLSSEPLARFSVTGLSRQVVGNESNSAFRSFI